MSACSVLVTVTTQRIHDAIITSLLHQSDCVTSFWRNNDGIIASCVCWVREWMRVLGLWAYRCIKLSVSCDRTCNKCGSGIFLRLILDVEVLRLLNIVTPISWVSRIQAQLCWPRYSLLVSCRERNRLFHGQHWRAWIQLDSNKYKLSESDFELTEYTSTGVQPVCVTSLLVSLM